MECFAIKSRFHCNHIACFECIVPVGIEVRIFVRIQTDAVAEVVEKSGVEFDEKYLW